MKSIFQKTLIIFFAILLSACATQPIAKNIAPQTKSTSGTITLVKGKTKQADITKVLGAPNIISKSQNKQTVWIYQNSRILSSQNLGTDKISLAPMQKKASTETTHTTTVILHFNNAGVLVDYKTMTSHF